MLEELEHARARGAPILAEFLGGSFTCDAHHMTEPQPQGHGVRLCIQRCADIRGSSQRQALVSSYSADMKEPSAGSCQELPSLSGA